MFAAIGNFLYGVLAGINNVVQNYGVSIILFTILIRLVCLPFDFKSRKGMRKMALIQPKLNELQRKYGNDKQKYQQKQAELMRKEGYNPLSSCLPLLLTWPLMIAMFSAMRSVANEQTAAQALRFLLNPDTAIRSEEHFLWVQNIWMTDSPFTPAVPTVDALKMLGTDVWAKALATLNDQQLLDVLRKLNIEASTLFSAEQLEAVRAQLVNAGAQLENVSAQLGGLIDASKLPSDIAAVVSNSLSGMTEYKDALSSVPGWGSIHLLFMTLTLYQQRNGWLLFPILAGVFQILQTKFNPQMAEQQKAQPANGQGQGQGMGNFMKYFFPILSIWFCLTSNAGFAVYWVASTLVMWVQSILITKYFEKKDAQSSDKLVGEGSVQ